jgi:alpha-L-fucosidase
MNSMRNPLPTQGFAARLLTTALAACAMTAVAVAEDAAPPAPFGPVPTENQLRWQKMEAYGLVCMGLNTYTGQEFGYGDESAKLFNPVKFDADKIVETYKKAGLTGLILVAKHHGGFCLWPSKYTEYSVKNSPYKNGKGDIVREFADACQRHGLKFGIYLSPWDRNHAEYARPGYVTYFRNQIQELLTNYGPIFEIWFDGANGFDGYFGGAKEHRDMDQVNYYNWPSIFKMIRELQPNTIIWDPTQVVSVPPDVRWGGNENGVADETQSSVVTQLAGGVKGSWWIPIESDVATRFSWFHHPDQNFLVKPPAELVKIYFETVGRNSTLLMSAAPDADGLIDSHDVRTLEEWGSLIKSIFAKNLALGATATASNVRGNSDRFAAVNAVSGKDGAYWATDDGVTTGELIVTLPTKSTFNVVQLQEGIALGQRVEGFAVDAWGDDGQWKEITKGTTIGYKRLLVLHKDVSTTKLRLRITQSGASPVISNLSLYESPYPILEVAGLRSRY